ncbi:MarR family winged helix-turn-helix transcriptional regulator [Corynebacterium glucuronolyticum]|uniref:MarR family winged helix-turn-helix transcriptional regulator n=1 Tax=Corynebacterium glucuronolyticum TaxID=39791 RepID=UPI0021B01912|nr:MarR family transcriptional regulator [Corynebacterium glucuronolyticum]MCT1443382.1 MarR family transcriptional regulator [Corynebacterium glucuronolyticum]
MSVTPYEVADAIRADMTVLYVNYFRLADNGDLTGPQLTILSMLDKEGPSRVSDIAQQEGIQMPTASNAIHNLEKRGLVKRERDPFDRRGILVSITSDGHDTVIEVGKQRTAHLADVLSVLDQDELELCTKLAPVIKKLANSYNALNKKEAE